MAVWSFLGSAIGGVFLFRTLTPTNVIFVWNIVTAVFIFALFIEFLNRIHQNDSIEIDRLLHLPISFHGAFILNYASSLVSLNMVMLAPIIFGLAIAQTIAHGWKTAVSFPLVISFVFVLTALMYTLRGWLDAKMKNKKTKGWLTIIMSFSAVGGVLVGTRLMENDSIHHQFTSVPFGWLSSGINQAHAHGNILPGILASFAMFVGGCASLWMAFNSSMKKYTGADVSNRTAKANHVNADWQNSRQFKRLPGTDNIAGPIAKATITNLLRAPEILAALLPVAATFLLGGPYLLGWEGYDVPDSFLLWLPIGMLFITLIGFPAFLFSTFSYDRDGFRAWVLSPAPRQKVLQGKNIGIGILTVGCGWISLLLLQCFLPVSFGWFLGMMVQVPATYLLIALMGNLVSVFCPIGFKRGSMQPVNISVISALAVYIGVFLGPTLAMIPSFISFAISQIILSTEIVNQMGAGWFFLTLSVLQLLVSWGIYRWCLGPLGKWLWLQETKIVDVVANIPE